MNIPRFACHCWFKRWSLLLLVHPSACKCDCKNGSLHRPTNRRKKVSFSESQLEAKPDVPHCTISLLMIFILFIWPTLLRIENIPALIPEKKRTADVCACAYHGAISDRLCSRKMCVVRVRFSATQDSRRRVQRPRCCSDEKKNYITFSFGFSCCGSEVGNGNNLSRLRCYFPTEVTRSLAHTHRHQRTVEFS